MPVEFYAESIAEAHACGVPVIFDSSGPSLVAGVRSHPELIKPNLAELCDLLGEVLASQGEVQQAAGKLRVILERM